jgi:hypothetical protein
MLTKALPVSTKTITIIIIQKSQSVKKEMTPCEHFRACFRAYYRAWHASSLNGRLLRQAVYIDYVGLGQRMAK